jgi:hypothetical protein
MCVECRKIDGRIRHYSRMAAYATDEVTLHVIEVLLEKLEADKRALHQGIKTGDSL